MKETIRLRKKATAGNTGVMSLYLDIYRNGKREYEFLKLYLVPELTKADKKKNDETMKLAEAIKAKRTVELMNGEYGFKQHYKTDTPFFEYYSAMCEKRFNNPESRGNWGNWYSCLHHLRIYEQRDNITFAEIDQKWVQGFKDYLETKALAWSNDKKKRTKEQHLSRNSKVSYFAKLRACLNQAFEERIIPVNPCRGVTNFKTEEGTRMYLTVEELKRLAETDCIQYPGVKTTFLFSCLTGLRRSDILKLTWGEVHQQGNFTRLIFKQKKTGGLEYLDINQQAVELMGPRGNSDDFIFSDMLPDMDCTNKTLQSWMYRAGIDKKITFHCGRHTFAVMMLDLGADIYTVSKLLGHRQLTTTQIYAKVLDKNKQNAVSRIPSIF
ncbi:MAG: site-specific integrase [Bacteroidales bacterium]|nr:site-specific integrase [Bacteroidales bacterium]